MSLRKIAQIERLRVLPAGEMRARFRMCIVDDATNLEVGRIQNWGVEVLPTDDHDQQLERVDELLVIAGFSPLLEADAARIRTLCEADHTPERIAEYVTPVIDTTLSLRQEIRFSLVDVLDDGQMEVRISRVIIEEGKVISPANYHRLVLDPMHSPNDTLTMVSNIMAQEGYGGILATDQERIKTIYGADCTPFRKSRFEELLALKE